MSEQEIIETIAKHFLCVRRLPYIVISHWIYKEGDENKKYVDSEGNPSAKKRTVVIREDGKKLLREERVIEKGGWWYVKVVANTDSTVRFDRKYDKFFAPTLEEAITLYLETAKKL